MARTKSIVRELADDYWRLAESIRAITENEQNRFRKALDKLDELAKRYDIPMALVGGMAAIHYGLLRTTHDIDIIVAADQLDEFVTRARSEGFQVSESKQRWHKLKYGDVQIDVVPEGRKAHPEAPTLIPGPHGLVVHYGLEVVPLPGWVELKLSSGRVTHYGDVVGILKLSSSEVRNECRRHLETVHPDYVAEFDRLEQEAERELAQERMIRGS
jgi:hypothetical protein